MASEFLWLVFFFLGRHQTCVDLSLFYLFGLKKAGPEANTWTVCSCCMVGIDRGVEICAWRRLKVWYKYRPRNTITCYLVYPSSQESERGVITIVCRGWNER